MRTKFVNRYGYCLKRPYKSQIAAQRADFEFEYLFILEIQAVKVAPSAVITRRERVKTINLLFGVNISLCPNI